MAAADLLQRNPEPDRRGDPARPRGQPLPLYGLPQHRRGGEGSRRPGGVGMTSVGQALKRKEDPRMITGRGNYTEDIQLPGMLHAVIVRSPEAHAAITVDRHVRRQGAPRRGGGLHRRGPGRRLRGPARDGLGAARRGDQDPRALAASSAARSSTSATPSRSSWRPSRGAALDAAERRDRRLRPQAGGRRPRAGARGRRAARLGRVRDQQDPRVGGRRRRLRRRARRGRRHRRRALVNHRTSGAPIETRCSIAETRAATS